MPEVEVPQGQRFSLVYLRRDEQLEDSVTMRRRLGAAVHEHRYRHDGFPAYLFRRTGLPYASFFGQADWMEYFVKLELKYVLDSVTIFLDHMSELERTGEPSHRRHTQIHRPAFLREVRQIFAEEGVRYSVDDRGGVHLSVDEQFETSRAATVQAMGSPRYTGALASLEAGYRALDGVPPDGRKAIRDVFGAAENLFKQTFAQQRLSAQFISHHLKPAVAALPWNPEALAAGDLICDSFCKWVDAAHKYRHEIDRPDPHQPPLDLAILMVSQGTAFVRWGGVSKACLFALCSCGSVRYAEPSEARGDPPCPASIRPNSAACLPA
jgi:hypothetical protein